MLVPSQYLFRVFDLQSIEVEPTPRMTCRRVRGCALLLLACGSVLADNDVSLTLLHDLGDGFVPAGTITGVLPDKVWLLLKRV
jgi:hypothetical protein